MRVLEASVTHSQGNKSLKLASRQAVNKALVGKQILNVEYYCHNTIKFELSDGMSVWLTPDGKAGSDLSIGIEIDEQQKLPKAQGAD